MIKQEIIEKIGKYFNLNDFEAEKIYEDIFSCIIDGVKSDNIADITNLGEFIIKYSTESTGYKKTVEFLSTLSLEEEINGLAFEERRVFEPSSLLNQPPEVFEGRESEKPVELPVEKPIENLEPTEKSEASFKQEKSVEDEIKRRREEILNKMTTPIVEQKATGFGDVFETKKEITIEPDENIELKQEEFESGKEKSFSDYFSETKEEQKVINESVNQPVVPPVQTVLPPAAIELHNQITNEPVKDMNYSSTVNPKTYSKSNGNGNGNSNQPADNSYYIWYKDSIPNTEDTQTLSYEYELLYQATKEAEYKSKLRIYVSTFILFFSIVLLLLIFSPVLYKYFFTPKEVQKNEQIQQETGSNTDENSTGTENQASVNKLQENNDQNSTNSTSPVTNNEQSNSQTQKQITQDQSNQQPKQEIKKEEPKQVQPNQDNSKSEKTKETPKQETKKENKPFVNTEKTGKDQKTTPDNKIPAGVTKSALGWVDDANKVIYIQLENGKFTIQESSWDSKDKADKRIKTVAGIIPGLHGNVVSADLGAKGTWYRTRFGEFTTLGEAKAKAEQLRSKEKTRLHTLLFDIFFFA